MPDYRIYLLSAQDKIEGPALNIVCDSNEDAVHHAAERLLEKGHHAESGRAHAWSNAWDLRIRHNFI